MKIGKMQKKELKNRLSEVPKSLGMVRTKLAHFALVTFAVSVKRLLPYIPQELFEIEAFELEEGRFALVSIVPFVDQDFSFHHLAPWAKFSFPQTNFRVYVRHRQTGESAVWFLGTTLGSPFVAIPRTLWSMPWHRADYRVDCRYSRHAKRYNCWKMAAKSPWGSFDLELQDHGIPFQTPPGFSSRADAILRLTHPVTGYFRRLDGRIGRYRVWHPVMKSLTVGSVIRARLNLRDFPELLTQEELSKPHSVLLTPEILFKVDLPPKVVLR